jgi:hypothetical protein
MPHHPNQARHRGCYDWPAIEGKPLPKHNYIGMKLTALMLAAPFLAIGFLWLAYYLVQGLGILALIFAAVLGG